MIIRNGKTTSALYKGTKEIVKRYKGTLVVYEAFKNLIASGVPPLTLLKCKGVDLIDYKLYGNSVQNGTPTPTTPIEVESVGDKTKNLVDWDYLLTNSLISKVENGYYAENYGTPVSGIAEHLKEVLKPNVTYTLSRVYTGELNASNGMIALRFRDASAKLLVRPGEGFISGTFSLTQEEIDNITSIYLYFHKEGATISDLQIVEGEYTADTMPDYEPYGYKIPVKVSGENLYKDVLVKGEYIDANGNAQSNGAFGYTDYIEVEPSTNYILSLITAHSSLAYRSIALYDKDYNFIKREYAITSEAKGYYEGILSTTQETKYVRINLLPTLDKNINFSLSQITTNIYLNEPLRKVGEYSDYVDFENKKVVRNITVKQVLSTMRWTDQFSSVNRAFTTFSDMLSKSDLDANCMSNIAIAIANGRTNNTCAIYINRFYFMVGETFNNSLDEFKAYLDNNVVLAYYPLATPIEEDIELPNIPTFKGTTILEVDTTIQPSNLEVVYKGK